MRFFLVITFCFFSLIIYSQTIVQWDTNMGMFRAELREDLVPITANNFIDLANDNFYDNLIFHRVISGFMIQDGCPNGDGSGGPGYTIVDEFTPLLRHDGPGVLSMANSGPNSGGSQYFITVAETAWLDDLHSVFGKIIEGMDVVYAISEVETGAGDMPINPVQINSVTVLGVIYPNLNIISSFVEENPDSGDGDGVLNPEENGYIVLEIQNLPDRFDASDVTVTLSCDDERIGFVSDSLNFGSIAQGNSVNNSNLPFEISILSDEVFTAEITVDIEANQNGDYPYTTQETFTIEVSYNQNNWPFDAQGASSSSALVLDFDDNGEQNVIFGDIQGNVWVVDSDGNPISGFPVNCESNISGAVAVSDINNDGFFEIVAPAQNNGIFVIDHEGNILFNFECGQVKTNPVIFDCNNDGLKNIIFADWTGDVYLIDHEGNTVNNFPYNISSPILASPAVGDINNDGINEIVISGLSGNLHAICMDTGQELPNFPIDLGSQSWKGITLADLDGDENLELITAISNGDVNIYSSDGSLVLSYQVGSTVKCGVIVGDINGNENPEIILASSSGNLIALDNQMNLLDGFPVEIGASIEATSILADMDLDGNQDIVFADFDGFMHSINYLGEETSGFPIFFGGTCKISATIADIDNDNDPEIIFPNYEQFLALDYKYEIGNIHWPCYRGNPERNGNKELIVDNNDSFAPHLSDLITIEHYPNPFLYNKKQNRSSITFNIKTSKNALVKKLKIFNMKGQCVREISLQDNQKSVTWDAKSNSGKELSSGIYFYKLDSVSSPTKKMILIK